MVKTGKAGGNQIKRPAEAGRVIRTGASRGAHIRALREALVAILEGLPDAPSYRRIRLRDYIAELDRAYPELRLSDVDVAQMVAEMDGESHED